MDREQIKIAMETIRAAYPTAYRDLSAASLKNMVNLWSAMFAEDNPALVLAAIKGHIATNKFAPSVAEIKSIMRTISRPTELTEMEAWGLAKKAIQNSAWNAVQEHEKLPKLIRSIVSPEQLRDWALSNMDQEQVIASNFMRSYRTRAKQAADIDTLPGDVKKLIITNTLKIERGENKGGNKNEKITAER